MKAKNIFSNNIISLLLALLCVALWGTAFPVIKKSYEIFAITSDGYADKILFAGIRFFLAGVMVLAVGCIGAKRFIRPSLTELPKITLLGFSQIFLQYLLSYIGLSNTTGTKTSVITALGSFLGVIGSAIFFKNDRLTAAKTAGCIIGIAGIAVINIDSLFDGDLSFMGEGLVMLSTVAATFGNLYGKHISIGKETSVISAYHLLIGGFALIALGLLMGGGLSFDSNVKYFLVIYLGIVSAVSFTVWTALLKYNPASRIVIFNLLIPIFGTIWSGILLGEEVLTVVNLISVTLIATGIILVQRYSSEKST